MSDATTLKGAVYEQVARIGKAVCSPQRLEILALLSQSPRHVESLAEEAGLSVANASRHLQILKAARLVGTERLGNQILYRLADASVEGFLRAYIGLAESRLAEIEHIVGRFHAGKDGLLPVDREALLKRVRKGEVLVLDVRPREEYEAGHIRGAVSLPVKELERRLAGLPKSRTIAAYCRGPYCMFAVEAAETLRRKGYDAVALKESVQDWKAMGYPIETGSGGVPSAKRKRR
jgi:rhodanese-related sulfurtransferase